MTCVVERRVDWYWTAEYLALDQLEDQVVDVGRFLQTVDRRYVGMIERREHSRLVAEASHPFGVVGKCAREDLDRDITTETCIVRPVNLAHPTSSERGEDFEWPEARPWGEPHLLIRPRPQPRGRLSEQPSLREVSSDIVPTEHRLDLAPQRRVVSAYIGEKRCALLRIALPRGMEDLGDLMPMFRLHGNQAFQSDERRATLALLTIPAPAWRRTPPIRARFLRATSRQKSAVRRPGSSGHRTSRARPAPDQGPARRPRGPATVRHRRQA